MLISDFNKGTTDFGDFDKPPGTTPERVVIPLSWLLSKMEVTPFCLFSPGVRLPYTSIQRRSDFLFDKMAQALHIRCYKENITIFFFKRKKQGLVFGGRRVGEFLIFC